MVQLPHDKLKTTNHKGRLKECLANTADSDWRGRLSLSRFAFYHQGSIVLMGWSLLLNALQPF